MGLRPVQTAYYCFKILMSRRAKIEDNTNFQVSTTSKATDSNKSRQRTASVSSKRCIAELETDTTAGFTILKKHKSDMTKDLGPVIGDSQLLPRVKSGGTRKPMITKKKRGKCNPQTL